MSDHTEEVEVKAHTPKRPCKSCRERMECEELRKRRRREASRLRRVNDPLCPVRVGMSGKIIGWSRA